jgi:hypothetical protein
MLKKISDREFTIFVKGFSFCTNDLKLTSKLKEALELARTLPIFGLNQISDLSHCFVHEENIPDFPKAELIQRGDKLVLELEEGLQLRLTCLGSYSIKKLGGAPGFSIACFHNGATILMTKILFGGNLQGIKNIRIIK